MHNPVLRVIGATACQSPIWAHPPDGGPGCHEPNPAHLTMLGFGRLVPSLARDKNDHFGTGFGRGGVSVVRNDGADLRKKHPDRYCR